MLTDLPLAAFDTETTGVNVHADRIVTASIITINGTDAHTDEWLVDPGIEIPTGASDVHGITTEKAQADGLGYDVGYRAIRSTLETLWANDRLVAIMNAAFDLSLIHWEGIRLGYPPLQVGPVIDPMVIDRQIDKYRRGRRTLTALCDHYGIELTDAHSSNGDALATARLAYKLLRRPELATIADTDTLMASQAAWHADRQNEFADYLRSQGKPADDVSPEWPIRYTPPTTEEGATA
ncbi:3'-5' exonuclease [Gordonia sp. HY285]|uniref:3'-5' exonuclease n=1 Tax=Gordonia liuliyuniae TaxID=2911517 RepID=UPI001F44B282|nr:3'-5' exonuclease [Gordonia liuliyuniae]MCF8610017.1 3'-5' exonuclease [Gordonia liuliyuniae]